MLTQYRDVDQILDHLGTANRASKEFATLRSAANYFHYGNNHPKYYVYRSHLALLLPKKN